MIRFAIVLLLLANAGYYAFSHGMLRSLGWAPENPSEPERLQQQVKPDALRIMTPQERAAQVHSWRPLCCWWKWCA